MTKRPRKPHDDPVEYFGAIEDMTPEQHLVACLAVIRGADNVPVAQLRKDLRAWKKEHGRPTRRSVDKWAASSFELEFGLAVLYRRFGKALPLQPPSKP